MSVTIKKDVPIPDPPRRGRPRTIPLDRLDVGASCIVKSGVKSVRSCVRMFRMNHQPDWEFRLQALDENRTRIWRTK